MLTDEQTRIRVLNVKKLFKMFPKYSKQSLNDLVTGDETWVYYFEPKRQCFKIVLVTKNTVRPSIGKRQRTVKKVLYVIFLDNKGQVIQLPVAKDRTVTGAFYKSVVLKMSKAHFKRRRPQNRTQVLAPSA